MHYGDRSSATTIRGSEWDRRIRRAVELAERFSHAAEILAFYQQILEFQRTIFDDVAAHSVPVVSDSPLRQQLDTGIVGRYLSALLSLVASKGTAKLTLEAAELTVVPPERQREMLENFLSAREGAPNSFFARVLFQPYAEWLASAHLLPPAGSAGAVCPICGGRPQAAVLRPEGDGGKRFLLCSFCLTEWEFRRILCPICGEENHQKLPRYAAEDLEAVRVEACDTCHFYLKSVDLTVDGLAVPVVDEVATVTLDLWAAEHGYKKAEPNLMGF